MKPPRAALAATALVLAAVSVALAQPAQAATHSRPTAAAMTFRQTTGDCEEAAVDIVYGVATGARLREATIIKEAQKLGVLGANTALGSHWYGPNGIVKLLAHYNLTSSIGSHTLSTIQTDLAAGDQVIAFVNAETLWDTLPLNTVYGPPPTGRTWQDGITPGTVADHALVLDALTPTTATVSDSGLGLTYTVPLAAFRAAVATSGYSYTVITK